MEKGFNDQGKLVEIQKEKLRSKEMIIGDFDKCIKQVKEHKKINKHTPNFGAKHEGKLVEVYRVATELYNEAKTKKGGKKERGSEENVRKEGKNYIYY